MTSADQLDFSGAFQMVYDVEEAKRKKYILWSFFLSFMFTDLNTASKIVVDSQVAAIMKRKILTTSCQ